MMTMKTKLTSLALLIPAVVLAQPAPQAPVPQPPQAGIAVINPAINPNDATTASNALKNAKSQLKEIKSKLPSNDMVGCSVGTSWQASSCSS